MNFIFLLIFSIVAIYFAIFLLKILDKIRYKKEHKIKQQILQHFKQCCNKEIPYNLSELNKQDLVFLKKLEDVLHCSNIPIKDNIRFIDILCQKFVLTNHKKLKNIVFYAFDDYFCVDKIYSLYLFVEEIVVIYSKKYNIEYYDLEKNIFPRPQIARLRKNSRFLTRPQTVFNSSPNCVWGCIRGDIGVR